MLKRKGEWAYSMPFSLGNFYNAAVGTIKFNTCRVTADPLIYEWNTSGASPSGSRHLISHASFKRILASGQGLASMAFGALDFSKVDISIGSGISKTCCFTFRIRHIDTPNTRVHNMRIWASDLSDFLTPHTNKLVFETSQNWVQNKVLPVSYMGNKSKWLPTSLPESQNLLRTGGKYTIYGSGDSHVSQYVYMALAASGTTPIGEYGNLVEASGFNVRVSYNVDNLPLRD